MKTRLRRTLVPLTLLACAAMVSCSTPQESAETPAQAEPETAQQSAVTPETEQQPTAEPALTSVIDTFPGLTIDTRAKTIRATASVSPWMFQDFEGRRWYIEQFVCSPGTKEHESLLVLDAQPSHLHAGLLLLGLEPGSPTTWTAGVPSPATGPAISIRFEYTDEGGTRRSIHPAKWTKSVEDDSAIDERDWVFAGSTQRQRSDGSVFYEADAAGTVIGLASFGSELLAWPAVVDHDEASGDLEWLANVEAMPPAGTPVTIVIEPAGE